MCNFNNLRVTGKTLSGGSLFFEVPKEEFVNYGRYCLLEVKYLPAIIGTEQVYVTSNGVNYPLIDKAGNIVRAGRMTTCDRYALQFGADGLGGSPHFVVLTCIPTKIYYNPKPVLEPSKKNAS